MSCLFDGTFDPFYRGSVFYEQGREDGRNFIMRFCNGHYDPLYKQSSWRREGAVATLRQLGLDAGEIAALYDAPASVVGLAAADKAIGKLNERKRARERAESASRGRATTWTECKGDTLPCNGTLTEGQYLTSNNGEYSCVMQGDGNFVGYQDGHAFWSTRTDGRGNPPFRLTMQADGNLVIYDRDGATWASNTNGRGESYLLMQNDRNVVVYNSHGATWASGSNR